MILQFSQSFLTEARTFINLVNQRAGRTKAERNAAAMLTHRYGAPAAPRFLTGYSGIIFHFKKCLTVGHDPAFGQVVRRQFQFYLGPGRNADKAHPRLAGDKGQQAVAIGQLDPASPV
jgi:hypothetical protein